MREEVDGGGGGEARGIELGQDIGLTASARWLDSLALWTVALAWLGDGTA